MRLLWDVRRDRVPPPSRPGSVHDEAPGGVHVCGAWTTVTFNNQRDLA